MKRVFFFLMTLLAGGLGARAQGLDANGCPRATHPAPLQALQRPASILRVDFDSIRALSELNRVGETDAYPWLSVNGLRLYYTADTMGNKRIVMASRTALQQPFGPARIVPGVPLGYFSAWLTPDEDTCLLIDDHYKQLWEVHRPTPTAAFSIPVLVTLTGYPGGLGNVRMLGPSRSTNGNELLLLTVTGLQFRIARFVRSGLTTYAFDTFFTFAFKPQPGQLFDHDLGYLLGGHTSNYMKLYMLRRPTAGSAFGPPTPLNVAPLRYNTQPTYQSGIDVLVFTACTSDSWLENELWLAEHSRGVLGLTPAFGTPAFTVFPNPTHHTVRFTGAPAGQVTILDAVGRTVRTTTIAVGQPEAILSVEGLPAGLYFVRAGRQTRRLVVE